MSIIKASLVLVTITAIVGLAFMAVSCPPLAFIAVPASLFLGALALGV